MRGTSTESQDDEDCCEIFRGDVDGAIRDIVTATTTTAIMCGVIGGDDRVGAVRGMP